MRKRWIVAALIGILLLLGVGGVAIAHFRSGTTPAAVAVQKPSTCTDAYKLLSLSPSAISAANPVCLVQSLKLTGELTGLVGQAYTINPDNPRPSSMCAVPKRWGGYPQALLAMVVSGKAYRLRISAPGISEHQVATINNLAGVVELTSIADPSTDWSQATGTVTLNPDGITGTIDANLARDAAGAQPVHVSGQWACGAPLPQPASDASAPCTNFYALNQLQPADVARIKARACNTENLTLSGDISAHLGHAVTDTAIAPQIGYGGDNFCGSGGEEYAATLKFSVGDESFLLDLDVSNYPSVGPGKYSAQSTGTSGGAVLFLGHADPANHGVFVADDQVFWLGSGGTFTIARDMKSGTLNATLRGSLSHAGSTVHIAGSWRCAA